jgi:hypothetical protein
LRYSTAQNTGSAYTKAASHDKEGARIHSPKQGDVCFWESLGLKDVEDCSVIHRIEGILNVQVQEDRQANLPPALFC